MIKSVSRRELLAGGAVSVLALVAGKSFNATAAATPPTSFDAFMALSGKLAGHMPLDATMGQNILNGFIAAGQESDIAALIADPATDKSKIAGAVVAAWYSGLSPVADAREVTGFNEALVWDALTYTKPWGSCGGETGYWGDPPATGEL